MYSVFVQAVGLVAAAIAIFSFQFRSNRVFFAMQLCSSLLFALHFGLLGAYSGLAQNLLSTLRALLLFLSAKPWARSRVWPFVLSALFIATGVLTFDGWISVLPPAAMVISTFAMWTRRPGVIRCFQFFAASPLWLTYNITVFSISGIITESFSMVSVIVYFIRMRRKELKCNSESSEKQA